MRLLRFLAIFFLVILSGLVQAMEIRPLQAEQVESVIKKYQGQPLIIGIWSLDCSYCHENAERLAQWRRQHKNTRVIMIAMDSVAENEAIQQSLNKMKMGGIPQYANAEPIPEKLRAALDSSWHGEMPRTLFVTASGQKRALTGLLTAEAIAKNLR